jgi:cell division protein ZapE
LSTALSLPERYAREVASRGFATDAAQGVAVARLESLRQQLVTAAGRDGRARLWHGLMRRLGREIRPASGFYLWGGVGRGKTWLMDLFVDSLPSHIARREHFHHFMRGVHDFLRQLQRQEPLKHVAARLAARTRVLCLDELYVNDIADAMLLGGLFTALLEHDVALVITSNVPPQELYRNGLQRARFLPAIDLLMHRLQVVNVDGGIDYRLRELQRQPIYIDASTSGAAGQMAALFERLAAETALPDGALRIQGRSLRPIRRGHDVVWFSFAALCEGTRSANDYAQIAEEFRTVLLSDVPVFAKPMQDNAARRFIALVDEFYDQGTKLVLSAAASPHQLYRGEHLTLEFQRTASRLNEMQTEQYLARPHREDAPALVSG